MLHKIKKIVIAQTNYVAEQSILTLVTVHQEKGAVKGPSPLQLRPRTSEHVDGNVGLICMSKFERGANAVCAVGELSCAKGGVGPITSGRKFFADRHSHTCSLPSPAAALITNLTELKTTAKFQ